MTHRSLQFGNMRIACRPLPSWNSLELVVGLPPKETMVPLERKEPPAQKELV